jgi:predicted nucleotidyltransferase
MSSIFSVDEIKSIIVPIARTYDVERMMLFGSYARKAQSGEWGKFVTPESDIDLRIDIKTDWGGLFRFAALIQDLETALGKRVDLLTTRSLDADFLHEIANEEIVIYER